MAESKAKSEGAQASEPEVAEQPKAEAPKANKPQTKEQKQVVSLAERQAELSRVIRGEEVSGDVAKANEEYQRNWHEQQRKAYPQLYRQADEKLKAGGVPSAQPGVAVNFNTAPVALEPGHDATLSEQLEKDAEEVAKTAGSDNRAPHEVAGGGNIAIIPDAITSRA